jgi:hypothetical protein
MSPNEIVIEFKGRASLGRKHDEYSHQNEGDYDVLSELNNDSWEIAGEIAREIVDEYRHEIDIKHINIQFNRGSIEWSGVIVFMELGALISGNIALIHYLYSAVRRAVNTKVKRRLPKQYKKIDTDVFSPDGGHRGMIESTWSVSTRKALIFITVLNLLIFFGGSFMSSVQVPSILDRLEESKQKLSKASSILTDKEREVESLTKTLSVRILELEAKVKQENIKLDDTKKEISSLNKNSNNLIKLEKRLEEKLLRFQKIKTPISMHTLWKSATWVVRSVLIFLSIMSLVGLLLMYKSLRNRH